MVVTLAAATVAALSLSGVSVVVAATLAALHALLAPLAVIRMTGTASACKPQTLVMVLGKMHRQLRGCRKVLVSWWIGWGGDKRDTNLTA